MNDTKHTFYFVEAMSKYGVQPRKCLFVASSKTHVTKDDSTHQYEIDKEAFRTCEEGLKAANIKRHEKIAKLKKEIARLEALEFEKRVPR